MEDTVIDLPEKTASTGDDLSGTTSEIPFQNQDVSKIKFINDTDLEEKKGDDSDELLREDDESNANESNKVGDNDDEKGDSGNDGVPEKQSYTFDEFASSVDGMVQKISGGALNKLDDINSLIHENNKLRAELEKPREPKFVNEKAKLIFEYANKAAGFELQSARQLLHVVSLGEIDKLSDKDAQFEAFMLTRPDLTREKGRQLFEADYEERFSDIENNLLQADKHSLATRDAKNKLKDLQDQFSKASEAQAKNDNGVDPKVTESIHNSINESLPEFGGLSIPLGDGDSEVLNIPLNAEEESEFKVFLIEPIKFIDQVIQSSMDENDNFNPKAWITEMFMLYKAFKGDLAKEVYDLGITNGQLKIVSERKNLSTGKDKATEPRTKKKTFEETMLEAVVNSRS